MVKRSRVPGYLLHKPTGYARVRIAGKDIYLGKFDSPESREAYHRLIAEWLQTGEIPAKPVEPKLAAASAGPTINEFLVRYWAHCKTYYRDALGGAAGPMRMSVLSLAPSQTWSSSTTIRGTVANRRLPTSKSTTAHCRKP
jgi:hypothetical protein